MEPAHCVVAAVPRYPCPPSPLTSNQHVPSPRTAAPTGPCCASPAACHIPAEHAPRPARRRDDGQPAAPLPRLPRTPQHRQQGAARHPTAHRHRWRSFFWHSVRSSSGARSPGSSDSRTRAPPRPPRHCTRLPPAAGPVAQPGHSPACARRPDRNGSWQGHRHDQCPLRMRPLHPGDPAAQPRTAPPSSCTTPGRPTGSEPNGPDWHGEEVLPVGTLASRTRPSTHCGAWGRP